MWPLIIGAGLGALTNKKNPLEGALLGGALGGFGGQFMPASGAADIGVLGGGADAFGSPLASGMTEQMGDFVPDKGLLAGFPSFKEAASYAKPVGESLMAANMAKGLLSDSTPQQQAPSGQQSNPQAAQILASLYQPYQMQPRNRVNWG
jgi:hypothetical protein